MYIYIYIYTYTYIYINISSIKMSKDSAAKLLYKKKFQKELLKGIKIFLKKKDKKQQYVNNSKISREMKSKR